MVRRHYDHKERRCIRKQNDHTSENEYHRPSLHLQDYEHLPRGRRYESSPRNEDHPRKRMPVTQSEMYNSDKGKSKNM